MLIIPVLVIQSFITQWKWQRLLKRYIFPLVITKWPCDDTLYLSQVILHNPVMEICLPLESFSGSQAPCRAVCGTCGCFQKMHGGVSAPSFCAFPHRVAFKEVSGHRVHFKSGPGNRGHSACGTTHVAHLEFPRETSIILRCAGKAGNPFHTK